MNETQKVATTLIKGFKWTMTVLTVASIAELIFEWGQIWVYVLTWAMTIWLYNIERKMKKKQKQHQEDKKNGIL